VTKILSKEERARKVIAQIAARWEDTPESFKTEKDGTIFFTFVVPTFGGSSTFILNPLPAAETIIEKHEIEAALKFNDEPHYVHELHADSSAYIDLWHLLRIAGMHFEDALWELPRAAMTVSQCSIWELCGMDAARTRLINETLEEFQQRKKTRFNIPPPGVKSKIKDWQICKAIKALGDEASQRQVAKYLNVSTRAVREWAERKGYGDFEAARPAIIRVINEQNQTL
jgi:hypothetical protein